MAAETRDCPACGAPLELASQDAESIRCGFCQWTPSAQEFPAPDPESESRFNAATLPLPREQVEGSEAQADPETTEAASDDGPGSANTSAGTEPERPADTTAHFRQLTRPPDAPGDALELLEQVPEELRGVLAARLQAASDSRDKGFRKDTVESLKARGYQVTEDARGARISGGGNRGAELSPFEMVRMAAEEEGGVQPRGKLPICPECQAVSPLGSERCQWCGADLPHD